MFLSQAVQGVYEIGKFVYLSLLKHKMGIYHCCSKII